MAAGAALQRSQGKLPLGLYQRLMGPWGLGTPEQPPSACRRDRAAGREHRSHLQSPVRAPGGRHSKPLSKHLPFSAQPSQRFPSSQYRGREV